MGLIMIEISVEDLPVTPTLMWSGIPLFDVSGGIRLIEYCEGKNVAVLGIEGFKIKGGNRVPDMDCIVDFSASLNEADFVRKTWEVSRRIIENISSETLMEFVLVRV